MRTQKTNTAQRERQIVQAVLDMITTEGIHGLRIVGIAERVEIVPSAVYRHYAGKEAVLDAVLARLRKNLLQNVAAVRAETPHALSRLKNLQARHLAMVAETPALPYVVFSDTMYAGNPKRKERVRDMIST